MNHSIYSADRSTHLKVVVLALCAAIAVAGLALSFRDTSGDGSAMLSASLRPENPSW